MSSSSSSEPEPLPASSDKTKKEGEDGEPKNGVVAEGRYSLRTRHSRHAVRPPATTSDKEASSSASSPAGSRSSASRPCSSSKAFSKGGSGLKRSSSSSSSSSAASRISASRPRSSSKTLRSEGDSSVRLTRSSSTATASSSSSAFASTASSSFADASNAADVTPDPPISGDSNDDNDNGDVDDDLLWNWSTHSSTSYHDIPPALAADIREALLTWYRSSRRKLPWRGDAPPYDGSTAGTAVNGPKGKKNRGKKRKKNEEDEEEKKQQPTISRFFAPKKSTKKKGKEASEAMVKEEETKCEKEKEEKGRPVTAYGVWVSEIMLQQTRVEAVIPYYLKWMDRFPTVHDLATASEDDVNAHWAGLGFYRRARLLHKGAKKVVTEMDGVVPSTVEELMKIDGIGRYTASAIASIAYDVPVPVVDGNVCRVLSRLRGIANHIKAPVLKDDLGWHLANQIVSAGDGKHAGEVNQALMELGATYCAPSGSGTDENDPLKEFYMSTNIGVEVAKRLRRGGGEGETNGDGGSKLDLAGFDEFISSARSVQNDGNSKGRCQLCDPDSILSVLFDISEKLIDAESAAKRKSDDVHEHEVDDAVAAALGHGALPTAPPKKAKREEVLAVAALSCRPRGSVSEKDIRWLMVKRPKEGLLAGQWEFPQVCVWTDDRGNGKRQKTPGSDSKSKAAIKGSGIKPKKTDKGMDVVFVEPKERRVALDALLRDVSRGADEICFSRHNLGKEPMEHIFSHIRHTMWVEYGDVAPENITLDFQSEVITRWTAPDGREAAWLTETEMDSVGITSAIRKILSSVKAKRLEKDAKRRR